MRFIASTLVFLISISSFAGAPVSVTVKEGKQEFKGSLYLPRKDKTATPALVVVIHEWWGKNAYAEMRAKKISSELGVAALAVDMYGNSKTVEAPAEAQALAAPFYQEPAVAVKRVHQFIVDALETAKRMGSPIDSQKIAVIGYCFGGTQALNVARAGRLPEGQNLKAVASFHGGLASSIKPPSPLGVRVAVFHGEADPLVSPKEVAAFKDEMKAASASLEFHAYPGAVHAFTNRRATAIGKKYNMPVAYNAHADRDSWGKLKQFLNLALSR